MSDNASELRSEEFEVSARRVPRSAPAAVHERGPPRVVVHGSRQVLRVGHLFLTRRNPTTKGTRSRNYVPQSSNFWCPSRRGQVPKPRHDLFHEVLEHRHLILGGLIENELREPYLMEPFDECLPSVQKLKPRLGIRTSPPTRRAGERLRPSGRRLLATGYRWASGSSPR